MMCAFRVPASGAREDMVRCNNLLMFEDISRPLMMLRAIETPQVKLVRGSADKPSCMGLEERCVEIDKGVAYEGFASC